MAPELADLVAGGLLVLGRLDGEAVVTADGQTKKADYPIMVR